MLRPTRTTAIRFMLPGLITQATRGKSEPTGAQMAAESAEASAAPEPAMTQAASDPDARVSSEVR